MIPHMIGNVKSQMSGYMQTTGRYMKAYVALTILCYVLDLISFLVGCSHFASSDDH